MTATLASKYQATYCEFVSSLHTIWRHGGRRGRLGLAISGGVDSMALASLCRNLIDPASTDVAESRDHVRFNAKFTAFIVDHKLRRGSDTEAKNVASELSRLGIESRILDLDWTPYGDPHGLSNLESAARRLRYQALGRACYEQRITSLLFAHHRDDQAETVLMRMPEHRGAGLRGIRLEATIPECAGIYGVDYSGYSTGHGRSTKYVQTESGGVVIARPLLHIDKEQLINICRQNQVRWFEDPTNADATLTVRNTIRKLLATEDLPQALRKDRLLALAAKKADDEKQVERAATKTFLQLVKSFDTRSGVATFWMPTRIQNDLLDLTAQATLLRKMIATVAPLQNVSLQDLYFALSCAFGVNDEAGSRDDRKPSTTQVAGVSIERWSPKDGASTGITIRRALPNARERATVQTVLYSTKSAARDDATWTEWQLWDGRYWIRVCPPRDAVDVEVSVRFLDKDDVADLRSQTDDSRPINKRLGLAKGHTRFTCPVLVTKERTGSGSVEDRVVALPSLGWSGREWKRGNDTGDSRFWRWDIRFRHVESLASDPQDV